MINSTAIIYNQTEILWAAVIILLAILSWFNLSLALYKSKKASKAALWVFLPISLFFSFLLCRIIYWYSHRPQFEGLWDCLVSRDLSAFSLVGLLPGIVLAALLIRAFHMIPHTMRFLDALSAPTAFGTGLLCLTCLFNNTFRGKNLITDPAFRKLPFGAANAGAGGVEYRYAEFFVGFLMMSLIGIIMINVYRTMKKQKGITFCIFLLLFSGAEFYLDSVRYDAGYFPFNGFVSIFQIAAAIAIMGVTVYFSIRAVKRTSFRGIYILLWILELAAFAATGFLEYLVQRHGDKAVMLYFIMGAGLLCMILFPCILCSMGNKKK